MTSYPKVNGAHIDAQSTFLQDILRKQWGYEGLVMSDWGATSNAAESIRYGLDLEMPGPPRYRTPAAAKESLNKGLVDVKDVDERILALLKLLRKTGKFTDRRNTPKEQAINRRDHQALIREAGAEGVVLLKNDGQALPINSRKTKKIALLGPLAKVAAAHGGGSASLNLKVSCDICVQPD
jgi:beta-glucosidase